MIQYGRHTAADMVQSQKAASGAIALIVRAVGIGRHPQHFTMH